MMLPDHLSYSSLSSLDSCPRSYYLSRLKRAEAVPAWYFVVGSAVHATIEQYLKDDEVIPIEIHFDHQVLKARQIEPDTSLWMHGGSKDEPVIEERALKLAQDCVERALEYLEDFTVWGVEPDITGRLPGCDVPIKAFPDLIGEHRKNGPLIVDWKTGTTRGNRLQLETYNALCMVPRAVDLPFTEHASLIFKGQFIMLNPKAGNSRPLELKETPESMGARYQEAYEQIKRGGFPVLPSTRCDWCDMKPNCKTMSGATKRATYYDTPEKDGVIPF